MEMLLHLTTSTGNKIKSNPRIIILLYFLFSGGEILLGQSRYEIFSKLSVENGLSSVTVTCTIKDSQGYMWIGTVDGLNRYNGYDFKIYRNEPSNINSLTRNWILAIFEDSKGTIWVSTGGGGLHYYDRKLDIFIRDTPFHKATINKIIQDKSNRVWFVGNAIISLDLKKNEWHDYSTQFPDLWKSSFIGIAQETDNEFWVASGFFLYKWNLNTKNLTEYKHDPENTNSLGIDQLYEILKDTKGNLWIATRGAGLDKLDVATEKFTHYTTSGNRAAGPLVNVVRTICLDGADIWLGTENGGLSKLDTNTNTFTHFFYEKNFPKGITDNSIWSLCNDGEGRLWVGTFSFGLCIIDPYQNKFSAVKISLENSVVNAILRDKRKRLWIGTEGGIAKEENGAVKFYLNNPYMKSKNGIPVLAIHEDYDGKIWLGTWGEGVFQYNENTDSFVQVAKGGEGKYDLTNPNNYSILQTSRDKEVIVASYNGLNIIPPDFKQRGMIKLVDSIGNYIRVLYEDSRGNVLIGSRTHLKLYNSHTKTVRPLFNGNINPNDNLNVAISCIFEDRRKRLWLGTEAGLYLVESFEKFTRFTIKDGLANQDIRAIQDDKKGNLWLSTNKGISFFDPAAKVFKNYDASDGLFPNGFTLNCSFRDDDNLIYFGGSDGIIVFDPQKIINNPYPPTVKIEDLKIFNQSIKINDKDSILHQHISETKEITLKYDANIITLDFVSLNFSASGKNLYAYRLDGFDSKWNYVGKTRSATYTNLDPGNYTFLVKASNNDGIWCKTPAKLIIHILPPWWKTSWAFGGYFILILILLYFFSKVILMRAQFVHDIKMERLKLENSERINQAKLDFFMNISHEFRTPLTLILGLIESIGESGNVDKIIQNKLGAVNRNAFRLLRLVNQLLDFRKAESGSMKLKVSEANIVSFIREVKLSFEPLAEEKKISFSFHASASEIMVWFDPEQFEKIILNLLSNAFKSTPEGGSISILVKDNIQNVSITVQDNGKGIKPEHFDSIFKTFFSYEEGKNTTGTGIGLALAKSLTELHHGKIEVDSIQNERTKFTITLLTGKGHFSSSEITIHQEEYDDVKSYMDIYPEKTTNDIIEPQSVQEGRDKKMLIVEDNAEVSSFLVSVFNKEYIVFEANDGVKGLETALTETPDIIISDVMMPEKDGITLCKDLKSNINTCHIPVILLTARTSLVFQLEGLNLGADDYITKPFNSKLLQLKVRNLLRLREVIRRSFGDARVLKVEPHSVTLTSRDEAFISKALKSVEDNMSNVEYSIEDLCKDVGMSKTSLFRKLKAVTGQSANEFIRTIRLKRAAQLLPQHELSIAEVAYAVGFNDPKYFRICFKKLFNVSPSEYSNRIDSAEES